MTADPAADPAETIAAALARLRGRRGPRPDAGEPDGPWGRGGGPGTHGARHGGPFPHGGPHATIFGPHGAPPWAGGPGWTGGPPWAGGHGRFGGPARLRLLEALAQASGPLTVSELGDRIGVDQPRASRLVQQSVDLGLVRREADPDDARRTRIGLTDEGAAILRSFRGDRRAAVASALATFTEAERRDLARLLTKLAEAWPH